MGYIPDETGAAANIILQTRRELAEAAAAAPQRAPATMNPIELLTRERDEKVSALWREIGTVQAEYNQRIAQLEAYALQAEDVAWRSRAAAEAQQREAQQRAAVNARIADAKARAASMGLTLEEYNSLSR